MKISMIGAGYVGLVSGACFAEFGHRVICADLDETKIADLNKGKIPIFEPGLEKIIEANLKDGRLKFTTDVVNAVQNAEVVFLAVGTPARLGDGFADLSYVYAAARTIAHAMKGYTVVVIKSTVPVGTGDEVCRIIKEERPDADFSVVSNPEFLREGAAISDFKIPDRIVIGAEDDRSVDVMREIYRPLFLNQAPLVIVSRRTSELTKYAANAFLAMKITFINEMADLCEVTGANVQDVARGIGMDNRIGTKFLNAGPGYGGSCFPKDTAALAKTARDHDCPMGLIEATISSNDNRKRSMARKVVAACGGTLRGKTIAVLGLTFKPNTDDMRDAPSIDVVRGLQDNGAHVRAFDPEGMGTAASVMEHVEFAKDAYDAAEGAHALVIVTEWEIFRALDMDRIKSALAVPVVVDLRNIYRAREMRKLGFQYHSIGRP